MRQGNFSTTGGLKGFTGRSRTKTSRARWDGIHGVGEGVAPEVVGWPLSESVPPGTGRALAEPGASRAFASRRCRLQDRWARAFGLGKRWREGGQRLGGAGG